MHPEPSDARRLRVVTLLDQIGPSGGAEKLAREVAIRLDPDRFDRTVCVSRWSAEEEARPEVQLPRNQLREAGVRFLGLQRRSSLNPRPWLPLLAFLRRHRVDILHSHQFGSNCWGAALGTFAGTPVLIAHEHTWSFEGQPVRRFLDRNLIARQADAFLTVSRADRRRMIEVEGIDPAKLILVPNGIPAPPPPTGEDVRAQLGIAAEAPVIGTVCTLRAQKALDVLIEAAQRLASRFPAIRVLIVGMGPERSRLAGLIDRLGLAERVTLVGHRSDIPDVLQAFDVGVCSSDFEGTPLSILEYMEAGLPVVSTRVGGIPDVIDQRVEGLLVERRDPKALADAVGELLDDPVAAAEMGQRGRRRRRAEFDIGTTVTRIEQLYAELCSLA